MYKISVVSTVRQNASLKAAIH